MRKHTGKPIGASSSPEPMLEMNMTPLIDVMLVLIIMLIITIPKQNHAINLTLPSGHASEVKPEVVTVDVDFDGLVSWNGAVIAGRAALESKLAALGARNDPTEMHIRANKLVAYKYVAGVMASAQRNGVRNLSVLGDDQSI